MIEIPKQLQNNKIRFIKIDWKTKRPIEKDWCETGNYRYTESEFKNYLKTAKSYGVACGFDGLVIVDIENQEDKAVVNLVMQGKFPQTFTAQTGGGGWHLYYHVKDINSRIRLVKDGKHYGEIQAKGNQCLGPSSMHPSGTKYTIINSAPIATITKKELLKILDGFTQEKNPSKFTINSVSALNWDISKLIKHCPGLKTKDDIKFRGPHPTHGSEGGQNFEIDIEKNTWYCFRCEVGGDAVNLIAMLERLVDATGDCSTQKKFREVFVKAKKVGIKKYKFPDDNYKAPRPVAPVGLPELFAYEGKKKRLNTKAIVAYLKGMNPIITIEDITGKGTHIYLYSDGYYKQNGEGILRTTIKELFDKSKIPWITYYETEIINFVKTNHPISRDALKIDTNLINFNNGTYDITTKKLKQHTHTDYFLYKIPWNYKVNAKLPTNILKYFKSTFNNEQKHIDFTQELFGYCLYSKYSYHGLFYLYGTGGNGKTVWLTLLENLLGKANVRNKSISSLVNNRFTTALLYGKLLNSCGELSGFVLQHTDMLKRLTAGDRIEAEFKNKDGFDFANAAKIITACNSIPDTIDKTDGWYDRQFILPFLQKFRYSKEETTDLAEKLTTKKEMQGLLCWAVKGLHRLLKNEEFTYPRNREELYKKYQGNTKYFVNNFYTRSDVLSDFIRVKDVRAEYIKWCKENSIPLDSEDALSRAFRYYKLPPTKYISEGNNKIYVRYGMKKVN